MLLVRKQKIHSELIKRRGQGMKNQIFIQLVLVDFTECLKALDSLDHLETMLQDIATFPKFSAIQLTCDRIPQRSISHLKEVFQMLMDFRGMLHRLVLSLQLWSHVRQHQAPSLNIVFLPFTDSFDFSFSAIIWNFLRWRSIQDVGFVFRI